MNGSPFSFHSLSHAGQQEALRDGGPHTGSGSGETAAERSQSGWSKNSAPVYWSVSLHSIALYVLVIMCFLRIAASICSSSGRATARLWRRRRDDTAFCLRNTAAWYNPSPTSWIRCFKKHFTVLWFVLAYRCQMGQVCLTTRCDGCQEDDDREELQREFTVMCNDYVRCYRSPWGKSYIITRVSTEQQLHIKPQFLQQDWNHTNSQQFELWTLLTFYNTTLPPPVKHLSCRKPCFS